MKLSKRAQLDLDTWKEIANRLKNELSKRSSEVVSIVSDHWDQYRRSSDLQSEVSSLREKRFTVENIRVVNSLAAYIESKSNYSFERRFLVADIEKALSNFSKSECISYFLRGFRLGEQFQFSYKLSNFPNIVTALSRYIVSTYGKEVLTIVESEYRPLANIDIKFTNGLEYDIFLQVAWEGATPLVSIILSYYEVVKLQEVDPTIIRRIEDGIMHEVGHLLPEKVLPPKALSVSDKMLSTIPPETEAVSQPEYRRYIQKYRRIPEERIADFTSLVSYALALYDRGYSIEDIYKGIVEVLQTGVFRYEHDLAYPLARRVIKKVLQAF